MPRCRDGRAPAVAGCWFGGARAVGFCRGQGQPTSRTLEMDQRFDAAIGENTMRTGRLPAGSAILSQRPRQTEVHDGEGSGLPAAGPL